MKTVPSVASLLTFSDLDGWMFRDRAGNLCGPFRDRDAALAAVMLVYGPGKPLLEGQLLEGEVDIRTVRFVKIS
jgi:hypothetical protein